MKFGLRAQEWIIEVLKRNGTEIERSTRTEDEILKVDFWVRRNDEDNWYWLQIQFSLNLEAIVGQKGMDATRRGIVPMWIKDKELEMAFLSGNGIRVVKKFWSRVEKILVAYPTIKRFRKPHQIHTQIVN